MAGGSLEGTERRSAERLADKTPRKPARDMPEASIPSARARPSGMSGAGRAKTISSRKRLANSGAERVFSAQIKIWSEVSSSKPHRGHSEEEYVSGRQEWKRWAVGSRPMTSLLRKARKEELLKEVKRALS